MTQNPTKEGVIPKPGEKPHKARGVRQCICGTGGVCWKRALWLVVRRSKTRGRGVDREEGDQGRYEEGRKRGRKRERKEEGRKREGRKREREKERKEGICNKRRKMKQGEKDVTKEKDITKEKEREMEERK